MSYFVVVTFDLNRASSDDYEVADDILNDIGLEREIEGSSGKNIKLPENTYAGKFDGASAVKVRDDLSSQIQNEFKKENLDASIFVSVGGSWAWGKRST